MVLRFTLVIFAVFLSLPVFAHDAGLPPWDSFRVIPRLERVEIQKHIFTAMLDAEKTPVQTRALSFCVANGEVTEVPRGGICPHVASTCGALSTKLCYPDKQVEVPINLELRLITWIKYRRFMGAYCASKNHEALCASLSVLGKTPPAQNSNAKSVLNFFSPRTGSRFDLAAVALSLLCGSAAHAADDACKTSADHSEFTFNDGRKTYLDFGMHRGPDMLSLLESLLSNPSQLTPDNLKRMEAMVHSPLYGKILASFNVRDQRLRELIKQGKVSWLGVDYTKEELGSKHKDGRSDVEQIAYLRKILKEAGAQPALIENLVRLMSFSPALYVYESDPEVRKKTHLVALDDGEIKKASIDQLVDQISTESLLPKAGVDAANLEVVKAAYQQILETRKTLSKTTVDGLTQGFGPEATNITRGYFVGAHEQFKLFAKQEKAIALNVQSQSGNGWISIGDMHEAGVDHALEEGCSQVAGGSGSSTAKPATK